MSPCYIFLIFLQQGLKHGMILKKVHKLIRFKQSLLWLKELFDGMSIGEPTRHLKMYLKWSKNQCLDNSHKAKEYTFKTYF
jgi:hypothetical protein